MLHYPKIPSAAGAPDGRCIAFDKLDGTNLHWDWDREFGWHSFGTRRDAFNLTAAGGAEFAAKHAHLAGAVAMFERTLADPVAQVLLTHPDYLTFASAKVFTEYVGPNSFAGLHKADEAQELRLIDMECDPFGIIGPHQFVRDFGHLPTASVVYEGRLTGKFMEAVRKGEYGVAEGVVCKGGTGGKDLWMVKVKTYAYLDRLKQAFADKWEDYWE